jgi:hypothetical protein
MATKPSVIGRRFSRRLVSLAEVPSTDRPSIVVSSISGLPSAGTSCGWAAAKSLSVTALPPATTRENTRGREGGRERERETHRETDHQRQDRRSADNARGTEISPDRQLSRAVEPDPLRKLDPEPLRAGNGDLHHGPTFRRQHHLRRGKRRTQLSLRPNPPPPARALN